MSPITVIKRDHHGVETWRYDGTIVDRGAAWVCLIARFNRDDHDAGYLVYRRGDRFTEWFYADHWYNVFRIEDGDSGALKGWYCNITRPAILGETVIASDDLALDLFVAPDGAMRLLDEDEFAALDLTDADRAAAWSAVDALHVLAAGGMSGFDAPPGSAWGSSL
ncbi:MAG: DUF402 domain-containing protein [Chloroflexota bacterium]|nr:DUF402 domain-containing protein [Chloroflexota bacterium]